jgi:hypothetical protein
LPLIPFQRLAHAGGRQPFHFHSRAADSISRTADLPIKSVDRFLPKADQALRRPHVYPTPVDVCTKAPERKLKAALRDLPHGASLLGGLDHAPPAKQCGGASRA